MADLPCGISAALFSKLNIHLCSLERWIADISSRLENRARARRIGTPQPDQVLASDVSTDATRREQEAESARVVVIFDFDGTLISRDSLIDFSVRYCLRRPVRLLLVAPTLLFALLFALRSQRVGGSMLLWAMTVGASTRSFVLALRRYASLTLPEFAFEPIFEELTRQVGAGSRVFIATGSVPLLVRGLLRARNLVPLPIVGTRLRRKWGGLVAETHCIGNTKVQELRRRFGVVDWSTVYTNSFADRALMSQARDITLVCPSRRTLLRTRRMISQSTALRVLRPR